MGEVTREEFNGLGRRVTDAEKLSIRCSTEKDGRIKALEDDTGRQESDIQKIFDKVGKLETSIAELPGKIDSAVSGMAGRIVKTLSIVLGIVVLVIQGLAIIANAYLNAGGK